jgi:predicted MFS family arabinose efflux permease
VTRSEHRKLIFAVTYTSVIGEYSLIIMPFIVGAMVDGYGASLQVAGRIVSFQLLGMALSSIVASTMMSRLNKLHAVYAATILVVAANIVCALGSHVPMLIAARFASGIGEGALLSIAGSIAAGTANPRGAFSFVGLGVAVVASLALVVTPFVVHQFGRIGTFWSLAVIAGGSLPFLPWLRPLARPLTLEDAAAPVPVQALTANSVLALFAFGLFWAGGAGLWVYAERIGMSHGLTLPQIGFFLGLGQLGGIPGPLFLAWLGRRWRLAPMFSWAIGVHIVAGLGFIFIHNGWTYGLMAAILSFCSAFLNPCFRTLMALLDRGGAVVAGSVAFYTLGYGFSPLLITFFLGDNGSFMPIAVISTMIYAVSMAFVLRPARFIGRAEPMSKRELAPTGAGDCAAPV